MAGEVKLAEAQEKVGNAGSFKLLGKAIEKETTNNEDPSHFTRIQVKPGNPKERGELKQGVNKGQPGQNDNSHDIHTHAVDLVTCNKERVCNKDLKSDDLNGVIAMDSASNEEELNVTSSVKPVPVVSSKLEVKDVKVIMPPSSTNANKTITVTAKQPVVKRKSRRVCLAGSKRSTSNNATHGNEPGSSVVRKEPECWPSLTHISSDQKSILHLKDEDALENQAFGDHGINGKFECAAMSGIETSRGHEIAGKLIEKEIGEDVVQGTVSQSDQNVPLRDGGKEVLLPKKNDEDKDLVNRQKSTKESNVAVNKDCLNSKSPSESVSSATINAEAVDLGEDTSENPGVESGGNPGMNNNKGQAKERDQYPGVGPAGEHQTGSPVERSGVGIEDDSCQTLKEQLVENPGGHSSTESKGIWESEDAQSSAADFEEGILEHPVDKNVESPLAQKKKNTSDEIALKANKALMKAPTSDNSEHDNGKSTQQDGLRGKQSLKREDSDTKENVLDNGNCQKSQGDDIHCGTDEHGEEWEGRGTSNVMDVSKGEKNHSSGDTASEERDQESYAELIMKDSDSGEESDDDPNSLVDKDSEEDDVDVKSDYGSKDMDLDSDPDSSTGGIVYWSAAKTRSQENHEAQLRRKERRKAKYQRKKASRQRTKAAKKVLCNYARLGA